MENDEIIISKLDVLSLEISRLREHIMDVTLTPDDFNSLNEAEEDLKKGKTKRL